MNTASAIQTYSGIFFDPFDPDPDLIRIGDIARSLSLQPRFNGHIRRPWSVANHSLLVSDLCPPEFALAGLMHDAAEAYVVDLPRPIKHHPAMQPYRDLEAGVERVVSAKFGLAYPMPSIVKAADDLVMVCEAMALKHGIAGWHSRDSVHWDVTARAYDPSSPDERDDIIRVIHETSDPDPTQAEDAFLARFHRLTSHA